MFQTRKEDNLLREINEIIADIENNERFVFRRRRLEGSLESILNGYKKFAKELFEGTDLKFIPLYIVTILGIKHFQITKDNFSSYVDFVKNHQEAFKNLHEIIREKYFQEEGRDKNFYFERVKEILLAEASIERRGVVNFNSLLKNIYLRIYKYPFLPETNEMYEFYLRNLPSTTGRTQLRPISSRNNDENTEERIRRLPWKSKMKVNYFAKKNHWNDLQKEIARGQHLSDYFNLKKNMKYQLKSVAPRYTLIIDLFFPGRFVYLLAINVNTRKAFAIPSPLITKAFGTNRYNVPVSGHKETKNVIKMFQKLQEKTPIKMIVCDNERAFLSKEFQKYLQQNGIEQHIYIQNNVREISETNDEKRGVHGLLAIMDRLCRTIRNIAYNVGVINQEIDPRMMNMIINEYNDSPHTTFYKIFKKKISPNMMDSSPELEKRLCYQLMKQNFVIRNSKGYDIKCPVRILNEASFFD